MVKNDVEKILKVLKEISTKIESFNRDVQKILSIHERDGIMRELVNDISIRKIKKVSTGLIQRRFKIGYSRAARIMDELARNGLVK